MEPAIWTNFRKYSEQPLTSPTQTKIFPSEISLSGNSSKLPVPIDHHHNNYIDHRHDFIDHRHNYIDHLYNYIDHCHDHIDQNVSNFLPLTPKVLPELKASQPHLAQEMICTMMMTMMMMMMMMMTVATYQSMKRPMIAFVGLPMGGEESESHLR